MPAPPYHHHHVDFDALAWITTPRRELGLEAVALGLIRVPAGKGYTFLHRHEVQEEVYVVIDGRGAIQIEDEELELVRGDLVRVSPSAKRALRAARDCDLLVVCAGGVASGFPHDANARYQIDDGEPLYDERPAWYVGDAAVAARNAELKERMLRARARREPAG